jgi:hypothetical protein
MIDEWRIDLQFSNTFTGSNFTNESRIDLRGPNERKQGREEGEKMKADKGEEYETLNTIPIPQNAILLLPKQQEKRVSHHTHYTFESHSVCTLYNNC